ncbi:MAG: GAF domain-containing sensor histidine kinase, partial [Chloroflexi bacterium]|nr:GAF domain-containing sensor histidine kinase [Chloroflexota bacterium]
RWMAGYATLSLAFAGVSVAGYLGLTANLNAAISPARMLVVFDLLSAGLIGAVTFDYLDQQGGWIWATAFAALTIGIAALDLYDPGLGLGQTSWRGAVVQPQPSLAAVTAAGVWLLGGLILIGFTISALSQARLPLHANRILFWLIVFPLIMIGEAAVAWGDPLAATVGQGLRLAGAAGAVYASTNDRIVDVRSLARSGVGNTVRVIVTAGFMLLGIGLAQFFYNILDGIERVIVIGVLALMLAFAYQLLRGGTEQLINQTVLLTDYDLGRVARDYSQRVANLLEVEPLAKAAASALRQSVNARRAALLLLTPQPDGLEVQALRGIGDVPSEPVKFSPQNPVVAVLADSRHPLFQFDIDKNLLLRTAPEAERAWLRSLEMDVFVPVMDGKHLSGILAVGPRASGDPYRQGELDVVTTLAEQTAVALQNARLFADLRTLNEQMFTLNESLQTSNDKLEAMDAAKTDFITIASHELRTPLTQLRGYADLLGTISKSGVVKAETAAQVTDNLLKACDRLDQVIGQMLDVSRIDVEAMQLRFVETTMDAILRQAVDPYAQAMRERRQTLTAQGIRTLPAILGDYQRLSQAFGCVIGNAIKFTPDGGRIEISGRYLFSSDESPDAIEIIVADTGVGIDPKYHELIFEKFFRVGSTALHSSGATKFMGAGPGLGLPLARGVFEGHGGRIWVESPGFSMEKLPGSQFHVLLPLRPPPLKGPGVIAMDRRTFKEREG